MKRIGILGGTFNPIHLAHIMLAETAYGQLGLDKVLIMPSNNPPHKKNEGLASDEDRAEMVRLAVEGHEHLEFSDFELKREGITYTSDTLTLLCEEDPDARYYFIIGADSLFKFDTWHEPAAILRKCALVCSGRGTVSSADVRKRIEEIRDRYSEDGFMPEIYYLDLPATEISSNLIRELISYEMPTEAYLAPSVLKYIFDRGLYLNGQFEAIKRDIKALLKPARYEHSLSVAKTAVYLAMNIGYETYRPYLAGILHDCAKYMNDEDMLRTAEENGIELEEIEKRAVQLVHAKVGAHFAKSKYGIDDEEIISAIKYHTTGKPAMTTLEQLIYISDTIEPLRKWENSTEPDLIRSIATSDLDRATYVILKRTFEYITRMYRDNVSERTRETYDYYRDLYEGRKRPE
jgi:nicotinate-nucleotide adenylyltransferase